MSPPQPGTPARRPDYTRSWPAEGAIAGVGVRTRLGGQRGWYGLSINASGGEIGAGRYNGAVVTGNAFAMLRARALFGRTLEDFDNQPGAAPVALIGHELRQRRFLGDPQVVGRILRVDREDRTVVGVMPEGFGFPLRQDLWLPLRLDAAGMTAEGGRLQVFGRLRRTSTLTAAP